MSDKPLLLALVKSGAYRASQFVGEEGKADAARIEAQLAMSQAARERTLAKMTKSEKTDYQTYLMLLDSLRRRKILLDARHIFPNPLHSPGRDCLTAAPPNIR